LENGNRVNANEKINDVIKNKGLFEKKIKNFKDEYSEKAKKHYKLLETYCNDCIFSHYYETTVSLLDVLINEYETMFERLDNHRYDVQKQVDALLIKHDDTRGTTNHYVLANAKIKRIWRIVGERSCKGRNLPSFLMQKLATL
jgi:hypothetical protein